jgi:hypothetical protein
MRDRSSLRAKRSNPSLCGKKAWIASSLSLLAMTLERNAYFGLPVRIISQQSASFRLNWRSIARLLALTFRLPQIGTSPMSLESIDLDACYRGSAERPERDVVSAGISGAKRNIGCEPWQDRSRALQSILCARLTQTLRPQCPANGCILNVLDGVRTHSVCALPKWGMTVRARGP